MCCECPPFLKLKGSAASRMLCILLTLVRSCCETSLASTAAAVASSASCGAARKVVMGGVVRRKWARKSLGKMVREGEALGEW
eukprot:296076-Pleurochrysis_carterae.AAC.3